MEALNLRCLGMGNIGTKVFGEVMMMSTATATATATTAATTITTTTTVANTK